MDDTTTTLNEDTTTVSDDSTTTQASAPAADTQSTSNVVFVGSLAWATDDASLRRFFEEAGLQIGTDETKDDGYIKKAVVVAKDNRTGRSKGYGFVNLVSAEEATKAITLLDGKELDGREVRVQVKENRPREDRPRRFDSRDGGDRAPRRYDNNRSAGGDSRGPRRYDNNRRDGDNNRSFVQSF
jgi:RNA recognition motif-containing protein